ncbi:uncharacterized protein BCR38DRAFT_316565, partial [Pseudomassariella vexata]
PVQTTYESAPVSIPTEFLTTSPPDAHPIIFTPIDFSQSPVPEFAGGYAIILDHVLSPSECTTLLRLAESSVLLQDHTSGTSPWKPAMVNIGGGFEILEPEYRNSDRIIWDQQEIVDRIWTRITAQVPEVMEQLGYFNEAQFLGGKVPLSGRMPAHWAFHRVNQRMRFLKYGPGQFFRPHCDGPYEELGGNGQILRTHFTLHLYLNDSKQAVGEEEKEGVELVGGATSFLSYDDKKKMDVDPKAGRVLIFQHRRLYHSGDDVLAGTKYTVRTDIMYEL